MACSMFLLIAAVFVLSWGARTASHSESLVSQTAADAFEATSSPPILVGASRALAGVAAACLSGVAYALLGVVIRSVVRDSMSVSMTLVVVTLTGLVALGIASAFWPGMPAVLATPQLGLSIMLLAGIFNAVAFLALTKSLQLVPVAHVNALNASQAAMGAVAGVLLFAEPSSWPLWLGVGITALGLLMMRRPTRAKPEKCHATTD
jgi:drug/metabolite transporter (DMT)-like permease